MREVIRGSWPNLAVPRGVQTVGVCYGTEPRVPSCIYIVMAYIVMAYIVEPSLACRRASRTRAHACVHMRVCAEDEVPWGCRLECLFEATHARATCACARVDGTACRCGRAHSSHGHMWAYRAPHAHTHGPRPLRRAHVRMHAPICNTQLFFFATRNSHAHACPCMHIHTHAHMHAHACMDAYAHARTGIAGRWAAWDGI